MRRHIIATSYHNFGLGSRRNAIFMADFPKVVSMDYEAYPHTQKAAALRWACSWAHNWRG